jgi:hypothetical protein
LEEITGASARISVSASLRIAGRLMPWPAPPVPPDVLRFARLSSARFAARSSSLPASFSALSSSRLSSSVSRRRPSTTRACFPNVSRTQAWLLSTMTV